MVKYDNTIENEYFKLVASIDDFPNSIAPPIDHVAYLSHTYNYGSESFEAHIKNLENRFVDYLHTWYEQNTNSAANLKSVYQTLKRIHIYINNKLKDELRELNLQEWKVGTSLNANDPAFHPKSRDIILAEQRVFRFYYECLSAQTNSLENVALLLNEYYELINSTNNGPGTNGENSSKQILYFIFNEIASGLDFYEFTIELKSELIKNGYISDETKLADIRNLFIISKRDIRQSDIGPIVWLNTYSTLAFFVKQMKVANIIESNDGSIYDVTLNRFVNSNMEMFTPKKRRSDGKPNKVDVSKINNIVSSLKRSDRRS